MIHYRLRHGHSLRRRPNRCWINRSQRDMILVLKSGYWLEIKKGVGSLVYLVVLVLVRLNRLLWKLRWVILNESALEWSSNIRGECRIEGGSELLWLWKIFYKVQQIHMTTAWPWMWCQLDRNMTFYKWIKKGQLFELIPCNSHSNAISSIVKNER